MAERTYIVEGMTCDHCVQAVRTEVGAVPGISDVDVDLDSKLVRVTGDEIDDAAVFAAVDEAGYEAVAGPTG
jgi:copper ion binding protein